MRVPFRFVPHEQQDSRSQTASPRCVASRFPPQYIAVRANVTTDLPDLGTNAGHRLQHTCSAACFRRQTAETNLRVPTTVRRNRSHPARSRLDNLSQGAQVGGQFAHLHPRAVPNGRHIPWPLRCPSAHCACVAGNDRPDGNR